MAPILRKIAYLFIVLCLFSVIVSPAYTDEGDGSFTLTVLKGDSDPLAGVNCYVFSENGSYLGLHEATDSEGRASFDLSEGTFKFRVDYLGYLFWTDIYNIPATSSETLTIPHQDVTVTVEGHYNANIEAGENLNVCLFTPSGSYLGISRTTDDQGQAVFNLPEKDYKVKADYLSGQYWSDVFNWSDETITIHEGMAGVTETSMGQPLGGINVYVFNSSGSYLGLHDVTDDEGKVFFRLPQGDYNFRGDYMGNQYWSGISTIIAHVENPVNISTGGGSFTLTVNKGEQDPLAGVNCYLFNESGFYLGKYEVTNDEGEVDFYLADGMYKIRVDYLGYQFWTGVFDVPATSSLPYTIAHQDVTITVEGDYNANIEPKEGLNVYLFTSSGSYLGISRTTDDQGQAVFNLPEKDYKERVDYLSGQYWSDVFNWTDEAITIHEGMAEVHVVQGSIPLENVNVYVFSSLGSYLNIYGQTGQDGIVDFRLPEGTYKFRADHQGSQYWATEPIDAHQVNAVNLNTGGGEFTLTLEKQAGSPLMDVPVYVFTSGGSYLGITAHTDDQGQVTFDLSNGDYKFRADHLGYQFWTDVYNIPATSSETLSIPHQNAVITVQGMYQGTPEPKEGVPVYLFTPAGSYIAQSQVTDAGGQVTFSLPGQAYKVRADYLGQQFWSSEFTWQDSAVNIPMAEAEITVTWSDMPLEGVPVYVFSASGSYLGISDSTDGNGKVTFKVPAGDYKFRADYQGSQHWSDQETLEADQVNPVTISTGGGSFTLTVLKGEVDPLAGVNCYLFSEGGSYLGLYKTTNSEGRVSFDLSEGTYKFRVDHLGYQFWSDIYDIPATLSGTVTIPHQDVVITVVEMNQGVPEPLEGVNVYLFTPSGTYLGLSQVTNENGQGIFNLPGQSYKVRADYNGSQYWSEEFIWQDTTINVSGPEPTVSISANPGSIQAGESSTLTWSSTDAESCVIDQGIGSVPLSSEEGGLSVSPTETTTYTITATGPGGTATDSVTVTVGTKVPSITLIEPDGVNDIANTSFTIKWTDADDDDNAAISLYYATEIEGGEGTLIVSGLSEDPDGEEGDQYVWDTTEMAEGAYYIYAVIDDGEHEPVLDYSDGALIIGHEFSDENKIMAFDAEPDDNFGRSVSISGDYAIVGAVGVNSDSGAAYIYRRDEESGWLVQAKLTASGGEAGDYFGYSVAIDGNYAIVGAYGDSDYRGSAFIFKYDDESGWIEQAKLIASDGSEGDCFGVSVSINGDYAIVGASGDNSYTGAAYIFKYEESGEGSGWYQQAKLTASDAAEYDWFGHSVSINSDHAIVGATGNDESGSSSGAAYIFVHDGESGWIEQAKLMASDGEAWEYFGVSVSISGDYVIVGAEGDEEGFYTGAAYIFFRDGESGWIEQAKLMADDAAEGDFFGTSVSISGGYAVVGAYACCEMEDGLGAAYIFKRDGTTWTQQSKFTSNSDPLAWDKYGTSVDIDGSYAIVGAWGDDDRGIDSGAAYIYFIYTSPIVDISADPETIQVGGSSTLSWTAVNADSCYIEPGIGSVPLSGTTIVSPLDSTTYTITATGPGGSSTDSVTVAINTPPSITVIQPDGVDDIADSGFIIRWSDADPDNNAAISLYYDTDGSGADGILIVSGLSEDPDGEGDDEYVWHIAGIPEGQYYVYAVIDDGVNNPVVTYSSGAVTINHVISDANKITASDGSTCDWFGYSVAISGDYAIVGASYIGYGVDKLGSAYIFKREDLSWTQQSKLMANDEAVSDFFGCSVGIDGEYAIVGASGYEDYGEQSGKAYIFKREGSNWIQQAKLTPSDSIPNNRFGYSVAISGDYAVVGALGVNSAYIFKREGTAWIQQVKLTHAGNFGISVSINGDYVIVGANGDDDRGTDSGAAYIFKRDAEGTWTEEEKLYGHHTEWYDYFGGSVYIDGDYVIVGAEGKNEYINPETGDPNEANEDEGAAYISKNEWYGWSYPDQLKANDAEAYDFFGTSVSISGDFAVIGAYSYYEFEDGLGAVYVFNRNGTTWTQKSKLTSSSYPSALDKYGTSIAIDGNYVIVGAYGDDDHGIDSGAVYIYDISASPSVSISAAPQTIEMGETSTLSWSSVNASSCFISPSIGSVDVSGSITISPTQTTTYTITATGSSGTATDSVTVTVTYPPPTVSISADPVNILVGESSTLSWTTTWADSANIDNGIGNVPVNGSISVSPTELTTYTITVSGLGGSAQASAIVNSIDPSVAPTANISADPENILIGESSVLSWTTANADSITITPGIGSVDPYGSTSVSPAETTTYTITAEGPGGEPAIQTVTVSVNPLSISITSPLNGDTIYAPQVTVEGSVSNAAGNETGVVVNGVLAMVYGNEFVANHVPLEEGENTITAAATDAAGNTLSAEITVTADTTGDYIWITVDEESGVTPFEATLSVEGTFSFIDSVLTYTGPDEVEFLENPNENEYTVRIETPGLYFFIAEVDNEGTTYADTIAILVMDQGELNALLRAKWEAMRQALAQSDIDTAVDYFANFSKEGYRETFNIVSSILPQISQDLDDIIHTVINSCA
jgi:hypothetical protein